MKCQLFQSLFLTLCILVSFGPVMGEELRPYQLPSQRAVPYQTVPERMPLQQAPRVEAQRFEEFRRRAEGMDPEERIQLETGIRERLKQAIRAGQIEEARYYETLCSILSEMGR